MAASEADGPDTLIQWIDRLAGGEAVENLDPRLRAAIAPAAAALSERDPRLRPSDIEAMDDAAELSAVVAALDLRSRELVEFWAPLLDAYREGRSRAPHRDLNGTLIRAESAARALESRKPSVSRDRILAIALGAVARLAEHVPSALRDAPPEPTRYGRGAFLDEDDPDISSARFLPSAPDPKPPKGRGLLTALGVVLVLGLLAGGSWLAWRQVHAPQDADWYRVFVKEVVAKRRDGGQLVIAVDERWVAKLRGDRVRDARELEEAGQRELIRSVLIVDEEGTPLLRLAEDGGVEFGRELLKASELSRVEEFDARSASAPPALEGASDTSAEPTERAPIGFEEGSGLEGLIDQLPAGLPGVEAGGATPGAQEARGEAPGSEQRAPDDPARPGSSGRPDPSRVELD